MNEHLLHCIFFFRKYVLAFISKAMTNAVICGVAPFATIKRDSGWLVWQALVYESQPKRCA